MSPMEPTARFTLRPGASLMIPTSASTEAATTTQSAPATASLSRHRSEDGDMYIMALIGAWGASNHLLVILMLASLAH